LPATWPINAETAELAEPCHAFLVDAAQLGFAVGAGFAVVENIQYLRSLADASIALWLVRGLGTAVLHGATTAIFAMMSKTARRSKSGTEGVAVPAWLGHRLRRAFGIQSCVASTRGHDAAHPGGAAGPGDTRVSAQRKRDA
jgi:hypothetical protein